jgi:hypothetical protein
MLCRASILTGLHPDRIRLRGGHYVGARAYPVASQSGLTRRKNFRKFS